MKIKRWSTHTDKHLKGCRSNGSAVRAQTNRRTDGQTYRCYQVHYLPRFEVDNKQLQDQYEEIDEQDENPTEQKNRKELEIRKKQGEPRKERQFMKWMRQKWHDGSDGSKTIRIIFQIEGHRGQNLYPTVTFRIQREDKIEFPLWCSVIRKLSSNLGIYILWFSLNNFHLTRSGKHTKHDTWIFIQEYIHLFFFDFRLCIQWLLGFEPLTEKKRRSQNGAKMVPFLHSRNRHM